MLLLLYTEFLHTAADLTLVPSAAIGRDLEAARATAGELKHPYQVISWSFALLTTAAAEHKHFFNNLCQCCSIFVYNSVLLLMSS